MSTGVIVSKSRCLPHQIGALRQPMCRPLPPHRSVFPRHTRPRGRVPRLPLRRSCLRFRVPAVAVAVSPGAGELQ